MQINSDFSVWKKQQKKKNLIVLLHNVWVIYIYWIFFFMGMGMVMGALVDFHRFLLCIGTSTYRNEDN